MNGTTSRCGRRGCKVVELPTDTMPNPISSRNERRAISIYRLSNRRTPTWEVVRWDIDEPANEYRKTAW